MSYNNSAEALVDLLTLLKHGTSPDPQRKSLQAVVTQITIVKLQLKPLPQEFSVVQPAVLYECVLRDLTAWRCYCVGERAVADEHRKRGNRIAEARRAFSCTMTVRSVLPGDMALLHPRHIAILSHVEDALPARH